jgi:hypothetical protein
MVDEDSRRVISIVDAEFALERTDFAGRGLADHTTRFGRIYD